MMIGEVCWLTPGLDVVTVYTVSKLGATRACAAARALHAVLKMRYAAHLVILN